MKNRTTALDELRGQVQHTLSQIKNSPLSVVDPVGQALQRHITSPHTSLSEKVLAFHLMDCLYQGELIASGHFPTVHDLAEWLVHIGTYSTSGDAMADLLMGEGEVVTPGTYITDIAVGTNAGEGLFQIFKDFKSEYRFRPEVKISLSHTVDKTGQLSSQRNVVIHNATSIEAQIIVEYLRSVV